MVLERDKLLEHVEWLLNEGESEKASTLCRRGLRRFPRDPELWHFMGDSLFDSGRLAQAERAFRTASELRPEWSEPVAKRAEVLLTMGRVKDAWRFAKKSHDLDRDQPHASFVLAVCNDLSGLNGIAHFWYRRAHRLDPEDYWIPLHVEAEKFQTELDLAIQDIKNTRIPDETLEETVWELCDRVDIDDPAMAKVSPVAFCFFELSEGPTAEEGEPPEQVRIKKGYVFRNNILRVCRASDDLYTQIYVAVLDELEAVTGIIEE